MLLTAAAVSDADVSVDGDDLVSDALERAMSGDSAAPGEIADVLFLDRVTRSGWISPDAEQRIATIAQTWSTSDDPLDDVQQRRLLAELAVRGQGTSAFESTDVSDSVCEIATLVIAGELQLVGLLASEFREPSRVPCVTEAREHLSTLTVSDLASASTLARVWAQADLLDVDRRRAIADLLETIPESPALSPIDVELFSSAALIVDAEVVRPLQSAAARVARTGARVADSVGGSYTLDAYLFSELDDARELDPWNGDVRPERQIEFVGAGRWQTLVATGVASANDPDVTSPLEAISLRCDRDEPPDDGLEQAPAVPFILLVRSTVDNEAAVCANRSQEVFDDVRSASDATLGILDSVSTWMATYVACRAVLRVESPSEQADAERALRDRVRDQPWQRTLSWTPTSGASDYQAMFEDYAATWISTFLSGTDCRSLTIWDDA